MKLYKISQNENNDYDTYSNAVVCAENEEKAQMIHPGYGDDNWDGKKTKYDTWTDSKNVKVEYIGEAKSDLEKGIVCASFHAG